MKLVDLEPVFVRWEDQPYTGDFVPPAFETDTDAGAAAWKAAGYPTERRTEMRERQIEVGALAEAQGIALRCPRCGNHRLAVAFDGRGVLPHHGSHSSDGKPSRWAVSGTGFADLTLHPSVDLTRGGNPNCWHGWIQNGKVK